MPIDFRVPPNDGDWGPHTREVKAARGAVCYGALAAHFGSDSPRTLEWRVDRLAPYGKDDDEKVKKFKEAIAPIVRDQRLVFKEKAAIHPQTLLAGVKERLKEGDTLPVEIFGIFRQKTAKVK